MFLEPAGPWRAFPFLGALSSRNGGALVVRRVVRRPAVEIPRPRQSAGRLHGARTFNHAQGARPKAPGHQFLCPTPIVPWQGQKVVRQVVRRLYISVLGAL